MLTEQTHLFNIFVFFFATLIVGYKMRSYSKISENNKSQRRILIINNGQTDDFLSKITKFLEKYATIDVKDIDAKDVREHRLEEWGAEAGNYSKIILVCKIADRMELYQEKIIQELSKRIEESFQVFYILNQGSGTHYVDDCQVRQVNVAGNEVDEEFIMKNFKDYPEMVAKEKWLGKIRILTGVLGALFVISVYGYFQAKPGDTIGAKEIEEISRLRTRSFELSQRYQNLLQNNLNLSKENNEMRYLLEQSDQNVNVANEKLVKLSEDFKSIEEIRDELEMENKALKEENRLQNSNLNSLEEEKKTLESANRLKHLENEQLSLNVEKLQNKANELESQNRETNAEKAEINRKYEELRDLYDQEQQKNKLLIEENIKLKRRVEELEKKMEQRENEFNNQREEFQNQFAKLHTKFEEDLKVLEEFREDYQAIVPKFDYANERIKTLETRLESDFFCNLNSKIKDWFSWDSSPRKHRVVRK